MVRVRLVVPLEVHQWPVSYCLRPNSGVLVDVGQPVPPLLHQLGGLTRVVILQARERLLIMTSSDESTADLNTGEAVQAARAAADPEAMRQLADQLHHYITKTFDDWNANVDAMAEKAQPATPTFARPVSVPPVRMEQLARTPEPTADLDDLVDLLVPRLVEALVPALREALRNDDYS